MRLIISKFQRFRDVFRRRLGMLFFDKTKPLSMNPKNVKSILFIRHDAKLGDSIVFSGLLRKIKSNRPDINIMILTTATMADLFQHHFHVNQTFNIKKRPSYSEINDICCNIGSVDMVVFLNYDMKMKDIYLLSRLNSKINVGIDDIKLNNLNIKKEISGIHYSDKFDYIASLIGIEGEKGHYIVPVLDSSVNKMKLFIKNKNINRYVLLNPFGSGNERKLSAEKINEITDKVVRESSLSVILLSSPDTRDLIQESPILFSERIVHFDDSESIYDAIAAVKLADLIISVDTSIVHIATGLNKKQIAIYSQDNFNFNNWHPCSDLSRVVRTKSNINDYSIQDLCLEEYV